jgi:hypothetical protein
LYYGSPIDQCSETSENCSVQEFVCIPENNLPYSSIEIACPDGCRLGKCLDLAEPNTSILVPDILTQENFSGKLTGTATDNESGLMKVEILLKRLSDNFYWNGSEWTQNESWLTASGLSSWNYSIAWENFSQGNYSLQSRAIDNFNNVESTPALKEFFVNKRLSGQEGTLCNYELNQDSECDTQNNYYCINGECSFVDESMQPFFYCNGPKLADLNLSLKQTIYYSYRTIDGNIVSGFVEDYCVSDKNVSKYYCFSEPFNFYGKTFDFKEFECEKSCVLGKCTLFENPLIELPESVSDSELLNFIDLWSKKKLSLVEEENDLIMQQIIEIWKNS